MKKRERTREKDGDRGSVKEKEMKDKGGRLEEREK